MAIPVEGKDVLLEVFSELADDYVPFTCAESVSITFSAELKEKASSEGGRFYNWHESRRGWEITLSGISDIKSDGRTIFTMTNPDKINTVYDIRLSFEDRAGNTKIYTGDVKLNASSINASEIGFAGFELGLIGIGELND